MSEIDYIVSLTTIPAKVEYIYNTLDSLLCQTMPVKAIVINIPASYSLRFDNASIDSNSIEKIKWEILIFLKKMFNKIKFLWIKNKKKVYMNF